MKIDNKDEYKKLSNEERRFSDFSVRRMSFQHTSSEILRKGMEFTSAQHGLLYEDFAAEIIRNNYVDLKLLTDFFLLN